MPQCPLDFTWLPGNFWRSRSCNSKNFYRIKERKKKELCTRLLGWFEMHTLPAGGLQAKTFSTAGAGVPTAVVHGGVLAYAKNSSSWASSGCGSTGMVMCASARFHPSGCRQQRLEMYNDGWLLPKAFSTQRHLHGCRDCKRVTATHGGSDMTCKWSHNSTLPERDLQVCMDYFANRPFEFRLQSQSVVCSRAQWRDAVESLASAFFFPSWGKHTWFLGKKIPSAYSWQPFEYLYGLNFMVDLDLLMESGKRPAEMKSVA